MNDIETWGDELPARDVNADPLPRQGEAAWDEDDWDEDDWDEDDWDENPYPVLVDMYGKSSPDREDYRRFRASYDAMRKIWQADEKKFGPRVHGRRAE